MQFKFSNYNHMLESSAFDLILYNFRTQNSIKIPNKHPAKAFLQNRESFHAKKNKWFDILLKKEFIVDEEFDEASWCILKHRETIYGNDTLFVEILPTNDCNFRCSYCFERHTPNFIDMESETKIIRFLEQNIPKCKKFRLAWFGGEPLLCIDSVLRISSVANSICKNHRIPMYGEMSTNGYLLTVDIFEQLVSNRIVEYQICLDGPEECHNRTRPHKTNIDSYQRIYTNLVNIKNKSKYKSFKLAIRCNITPSIEKYLDKYLATLSECFSHDPRFFVLFQCVRNWGGDCILPEHIVDNESRIYKKWYAKASELGLCSKDINMFTPFVGYCRACRKNGYVINYDASIHKCSLAMDSKYSEIDQIGYIDLSGKIHIDDKKVARWLVEPKVKDSCRVCTLFPICMGGTCFFSKNIKNKESCNKYLLSIIDNNILNWDKLGLIPLIGGGKNE